MNLFEPDFIPSTNGKYYLAFDNGVSASMAIIKPSGEIYCNKVPTRSEQSYTKTKQNITRIDFNKLVNLLAKQIPENANVHVVMERAMVNPGRFKATVSALRALESVLIVVQDIYNFPFSYVDSKAWQKLLLPSGLKGDELKKASLDIGNRLFPQFKDFKHPDRDGLLICEYARRSNL